MCFELNSCPLQEQQALLSSKLSSQPFLLLHSLWNTLTNVVVDKCEGKTNWFFSEEDTSADPATEAGMQSLSLQTDRLPKHVARSQGSHVL